MKCCSLLCIEISKFELLHKKLTVNIGKGGKRFIEIWLPPIGLRIKNTKKVIEPRAKRSDPSRCVRFSM